MGRIVVWDFIKFRLFSFCPADITRQQDMMNLRSLASLLLFALVYMCFGEVVFAQRDFTRDNIVFVLVDDMGFGDLNAKRMPRLDALTKRSGSKFSNFLVHQNCTPSRVAFLTGNDPSRYDMYANMPRPIRRGLPPEAELISERLKTFGYSTCLVGKWGVGNAFREQAFENGFDETLQRSRINNAAFSTDRFSDVYQTDGAIRFIEVAQEPFFLYAPFESPHEEFKAPRDYFERNRGEFRISRDEEAKYLTVRQGIVQKRTASIPAEIKLRIDRCLYYSMISVLDDQVDRLYRKLLLEGKADHTLFMFASDNGGITPFADNGIYRGLKDQIYDGAHRSCNAVVWPGVVKSGQQIDSNIWIGDLFPTFAEIAGESDAGIGLDGGSAIAAILRNATVRRGVANDNPALIAHLGKTRRPQDRHLLHGEFAVWRLGAKYIRFVDLSLQGEVVDVREELYLLSRDPGESQNLADSDNFEQLLRQLRREYWKWGGNQRLVSLKIDDHAKDVSNFSPPPSWLKRRNSFESSIWP